jgi:hypothetical protein
VTALLDLFRTLASFDPPRRRLAGAPWDDYVDWSIAQGLAPLAAYNLEYRLAGGGAPEWARDRLLSVYQGSLNDNVMKLVNFKRAVDDLEGRKVLLVGGASFAEALYPHVAFRPVPDVRLLVRPNDLDGLTGFLARSDFKPEPGLVDPLGAARVLTDGRTQIFLHTSLLGGASDEGLFERALPMKVYGPSLFRLDLEDALLALCLEQARAGYGVPMLTYVDLRELLTGASSMGGPYSRPLDVAALRQRASAARLDRALFVSTSILERLFPDLGTQIQAVRPELSRGRRELLERVVVGPASAVGQLRTLRGLGRLSRLLSGGRN